MVVKPEEIRESYFKWLIDDVLGEPSIRESHLYLARALFKKEFYWIVVNDENRAVDGRLLRDEYTDKTGMDVTDILACPCSVLEMLIALAVRIACDIMPDVYSQDVAYWFWLMITNLKLDGFDDRGFDMEYVDYILEKFMERDYDYEGFGGLFPRKNATEDQSKVEIWYQMQGYFLENYEI